MGTDESPLNRTADHRPGEGDRAGDAEGVAGTVSHEPTDGEGPSSPASSNRSLWPQYVKWKVEDRFVLARRTKHQQDVYRDSCVELFFTPGGVPEERGYFNLETNCAGVKLFGAHIVGGKDEKFTAADFASVVTASSLEGPIDREIVEPTTWTLEYKIPLGLLERHAKIERPRPGVTWRANFYKCADDSSHPHWLTWSPVTNAEPSFHLPKYFGILAFE